MKQTVQLGALSAANLGIAFLFQWCVLTQLGPGTETDALFAGMTLPQLTLAVISGSLMHVLVPLLAGEDEERLRRDAWSFLALVGGVFCMLAACFYATASWWVPLLVPGFDASAQALTVELTRIQLIGMVFAAINGVQWAAYHARQQFLWAEGAPILANLAALLLLVWALPRFGVTAAAWVGVLRMVLETLLLSPGMGRPVFIRRRALLAEARQTSAIQVAWQRMKPLLLGTAYYKTDPLVDRFLLSNAGSGSISLYYLALQIYGAANQIINKAIAAPLMPQLSMMYKAGDSDGFRRVYHRKLVQVGVVGLAGLLVVGLWGQLLLQLLIGHGNVNADNVSQLWWILLWLGGVFIGGAAGQICAMSFYAGGDTTTPTRMSIVTYTCYVPCKLLSFHVWGVQGLALTTSVYYLANVLLQMYLLHRKT